MSSYTVDERSQGHRHNERTKYDAPLVHSILAAVPVVHVAFSPPSSPFPSVLPMLAALSTHNDDPVIYLHGSSVARLVTLTRDAGPEGLPVTLSATSVDGFVLALTPFAHSVNYRSAVIFGRATLLSSPADEDEILSAMHAVTERILPGRWDASRVPPVASEIRATGILRVRIETASAKVRTGAPKEERRDVKDGDVRGKVWTGVVPAYTLLGEPVPAAENLVDDVPGYIAGWVRDENRKGQAYAERVTVDE
ncbi:hypothetical protein ANO11243_006970 [Dothideomycetidae sp. 11243]|nr:hypothetical protein ANO11243_006970 [fungal sp. No.11243]